MAASASSKREEAPKAPGPSVTPTTNLDQDGFVDEKLPTYSAQRASPSLIRRMSRAFSMNARKRKGDYAYNTIPSDSKSHHALKRDSTGEARTSRGFGLAGFLRYALAALPVLVLMIFGVVHILEMVTGRDHIHLDAYEVYMPDWGRKGHIREGLASYPTDATRDVLPIACHSHNDYWRRAPLFDAIHWGCTGVEADVFLIDDELYVGHNPSALTPRRTLRNLYVDPLVDLLDKMNPTTAFGNTTGHGVFDVDPEQTLVLLVDLKTNGRDTLRVVSQQLESLREKGYLSFWDGAKVHSRAVTVVGTGNTPFDAIVSNTTYRDIFFDAPLKKLWEPYHSSKTLAEPEKDAILGDDAPSGQGNVGTEVVSSADAFNTNTSYYASISFKRAVGHIWRGHLSHAQREIIRGQIQGAKRRGLKARYWDTPSWPIGLRNRIWQVLVDEGADVLNVDDLRGAATEDWRRRRMLGWW